MVNFFRALWAIIEEFFATRYEVVPMVTPAEAPPAPVVVVPVVVNKATVTNFALAIESREGSIPPSPQYPKGTPAWRNNNPGNCKGIDGNFLVFSSYEIGFAYLENYIRRVMANKHKAYPKDPTIAQYFAVYAPTEDANDPVSYAVEVAKKLEVTSSFLIKNLI